MVVQVALPLPIAKTFSYSVPHRLQPFIKISQRVTVPFHNRYTYGYITDIDDGIQEGLKEVLDILDLYPLIQGEIARLCQWACGYYITPIGLVLKYAVPKYIRPDRYLFIESAHGVSDRRWAKQLHGIKLERAFSLVGRDKILGYLKDGAIILRDRFTKKDFSYYSQDEDKKGDVGKPIILVAGFKTRLEYYSGLIETQIRQNKNILMLIPDYETTGQFFYKILTEKFGKSVFWYGSSVKQDSRMETYFRARNETGQIILGNKSCVFLPINSLSLIIVERHEEDSFRNEREFRFNAWEVGVKRAELEAIPIILGSVAPKIEVIKRASDSDYRIIKKDIPSLAGSTETKIDKKPFFSGSLPEGLLNTVEDALREKRQAVIYTPRKHYSSQMSCLDCNTILTCPLCAGILSYKKSKNKTVCPSCQREFDYTETCPQCKGSLIRFLQFGAEYIAENLKNILCNIEVILVTGDNIEKQIKRLQARDSGQSRIIVGTNILSRLYGIGCDELIFIGLEDTLNIAGYRAGERLFQTLMNTVDALNPGQILFFTDTRKDFNLKRFTDYNGFYMEELDKRKSAGFPPYNDIYLIEVEKNTIETGERVIKRIKKHLEASGLSEYLMGPYFEKRKKYRWRIIVKNGHEMLHELLLSLYNMNDVVIEVNPINI